MAEPLVDVDLDALAPAPKIVKLAGQKFKLPGDMPLPLFLRLQAYDQRITAGVDETVLLSELQDELLSLLQVHQPKLKALPESVGVQTLMGSLGAIYGGGAVGEQPQPNRATRRQKKRTPSAKARPARATATSR